MEYYTFAVYARGHSMDVRAEIEAIASKDCVTRDTPHEINRHINIITQVVWPVHNHNQYIF